MNGLIRTMRFAAVVPVLALGVPASAGIVNPVVDLAPGYAMENGRAVGDHTSTAADTLCIVGFVADFNEPFDDLDPNDPTREYTYVYKGLISQGTVVSGGGSFTFYDTDYSGGVLEIYCDPAQNADYADKSTFQDGDMILAAGLSDFRISTQSFNCSGSQNANLVFTGGSLFNRVSDDGVGFDGVITGAFSVCASAVHADRQAEGYFGLSDTKVDVSPPVPTEDRSWGSIKNSPR